MAIFAERTLKFWADLCFEYSTRAYDFMCTLIWFIGCKFRGFVCAETYTYKYVFSMNKKQSLPIIARLETKELIIKATEKCQLDKCKEKTNCVSYKNPIQEKNRNFIPFFIIIIVIIIFFQPQKRNSSWFTNE